MSEEKKTIRETIIEANHEFTEDEVAYIESNDVTMEEISAVLATIPEDADRPTIETVIGSAAKAKLEKASATSAEA